MKLRILFLLSLCAVMLVSGIACKAGSSSEGMTAEQIIQNMETAALTYDTVHIEATETMYGIVRESWGSEYVMNMDISMTGDMDLENMQIYMDALAIIETNAGYDTESETMDVQMYMIDGWMYMGTELYGQNIWMKTQITEEMWDEQYSAMQGGEALLVDAIEINIVGKETTNGVSCWKLDVNPDMAKVMEWAQTQMEAEVGELPTDIDFTEMFNDVSVTMWIAEDTFYTIRCDVTMTVNIDGDAMDVSMVVNYSDYNKPVNITLPDEASEAIEIPYY